MTAQEPHDRPRDLARLPDAALIRLSARLRGLARTLVRDADADDVVQDAWAAALQSAPDASRLSAWMATTVRRLGLRRSRADSRRRRREETVARPEASEPDLARERLAAAQVLLAEVDALEPDLRSAVSLRYLEGLPPRVVAQRLGVPVATVRSRVRRGVERLRERLRQRHGMREWAIALGPLLRRGALAPAWSVTVLPVLLTMPIKVLVGLLTVAAAALGAWLVLAPPAAVPVPVPVAVAPDAGALASAAVAAPVPRGAPPSRVAAASPVEVATASFVVRGRWVAAQDGAPLPSCRVTLDAELGLADAVALARLRDGEVEPPQPVSVRTDRDGGFVLEAPPLGAAFAYRLEIDAVERVPLRWRFESLRVGPRLDLGALRVPRGVAARVVLRDTRGRPQPDLLASIDMPQRPRPGAWVAPDTHFDARTDGDGALPLPTPLATGTWRFVCRDREIVEGGTWELTAASADPVHEIVVRAAEDVPTLSGVVVDAHGAPVEDVAVQPIRRETFFGSPARSDADGRFVVPRWSTDRGTPHRLRLTKPGSVTVETEPVAWGQTGLRLVVADAPRIALHVVDAETGLPVERFGVRVLHGVGWAANDDWRVYDGALVAVGTHAAGRAEVALDHGPHRLYVQPADEQRYATSAPLDLDVADTGLGDAVVRLPVRQPVRLRVVHMDGRPAASADVELLAGDGDEVVFDPHRSLWLDGASWPSGFRPQAVRVCRASTDASGEVTVGAPAGAPVTVRVRAAGAQPFVRTGWRLAAATPPVVVRLGAGAVVTGRLRPADFVARVAALSPTGRPP